MTRPKPDTSTYVATLQIELATSSIEYARMAAQDLAAVIFADDDVNAVSCAVEAGKLADPEEAAA